MKSEIVFILVGFQAVIFAIMLLMKNQKGISDKLLTGFLLTSGIYLTTCFFVYENGKHVPENLIYIIYAQPLLLCIGPFMYLYTKSLLVKDFRFKKVHLLHFLPVFVHYILEIIIVNQHYGSPEFKMYFKLPYVHLALYTRLLSVPLYLGIIYCLIIKYRKSLETPLLKIDKINLKWIKTLTLVLTIAYVISFVTIIFKKHLPFSFNRNIIMMYTYSSFVFFVGIYGYKQKNIFAFSEFYFGEDKRPGTKIISLEYDASTENIEKLKEISNRLNELMKNKKPYLNPELGLQDLSFQINTSVHNLSASLNQVIKQNFYDYMNEFRLNEVLSKLNKKLHHSYNIEYLAFESGFNSKATFYRVFKKLMKMTPGEYIKNHIPDKNIKTGT